MRYFLGITGGLLWAFAALFFVSGPTSMQEAVSALIGISGSVLIAGGCIVSAVQDSAAAKGAPSKATAQEFHG